MASQVDFTFMLVVFGWFYFYTLRHKPCGHMLCTFCIEEDNCPKCQQRISSKIAIFFECWWFAHFGFKIVLCVRDWHFSLNFNWTFRHIFRFTYNFQFSILFLFFLNAIPPICILDTIPLDINLDIVLDTIPQILFLVSLAEMAEKG